MTNADFNWDHLKCVWDDYLVSTLIIYSLLEFFIFRKIAYKCSTNTPVISLNCWEFSKNPTSYTIVPLSNDVSKYVFPNSNIAKSCIVFTHVMLVSTMFFPSYFFSPSLTTFNLLKILLWQMYPIKITLHIQQDETPLHLLTSHKKLHSKVSTTYYITLKI